ncbi:hypothetical protein [Parapedobacter koreensis]|uniref:hypothetical protein n=1 Tax=Parapedobacter koreensis TaxID=332977 RepID=UPI0015A4EF1B|nr:hypothetical protein [Parapedobacter koreensis]
MNAYLCTAMEAKQPDKEDYSFWTRYKRFAGNEILLYVIMVVGILLGIIIFS